MTQGRRNCRNCRDVAALTLFIDASVDIPNHDCSCKVCTVMWRDDPKITKILTSLKWLAAVDSHGPNRVQQMRWPHRHLIQ